MKRIKIHVESVSFDGYKICVTDKKVMHGWSLYIDPENIEWFSVDEDNRSIHHSLKVGSVIECDGNINAATRGLYNVKFVED